MDSNQQACLSLLREGDRDRYLCALLAPDQARGSLASLYAFNLELARVRELVSEPMLGEVRMQWWKDLLDGEAHGEASGHPVAAALLESIEKYQLSRPALINMIEARRFDLYDDPMPDRNTFEGYAGETASTLIQLSTQVLDASDNADTATAAGHAGVAQLVAGVLQLMPLHRSRGQVYVPGDILAATGLDREGFLSIKDSARLEQALLAFIALGREHLGRARNSMTAVSACNFAAFLPVTTASMVFDRAEASGASLLEKPLRVPQWRRQIRFWNAARRRRL